MKRKFVLICYNVIVIFRFLAQVVLAGKKIVNSLKIHQSNPTEENKIEEKAPILDYIKNEYASFSASSDHDWSWKDLWSINIYKLYKMIDNQSPAIYFVK